MFVVCKERQEVPKVQSDPCEECELVVKEVEKEIETLTERQIAAVAYDVHAQYINNLLKVRNLYDKLGHTEGAELADSVCQQIIQEMVELANEYFGGTCTVETHAGEVEAAAATQQGAN